MNSLENTKKLPLSHLQQISLVPIMFQSLICLFWGAGRSSFSSYHPNKQGVVCRGFPLDGKNPVLRIKTHIQKEFNMVRNKHQRDSNDFYEKEKQHRPSGLKKDLTGYI